MGTLLKKNSSLTVYFDVMNLLTKHSVYYMKSTVTSYYLIVEYKDSKVTEGKSTGVSNFFSKVENNGVRNNIHMKYDKRRIFHGDNSE